MFNINLLVLAIAAVAILEIHGLPVWEDGEGNSYLLMPLDQAEQPSEQSHQRHTRAAQRETTYDIGNNHAGLGQKYTFENDDHKFSANAYASRDYKPKGPLTTGQGAEYVHKPSNSNFQVNAENTRGAGTDFKASGIYNFYQTPDKRGRVGVGGEYERHYGGRSGTSDPKYNVLLKGSYDF